MSLPEPPALGTAMLPAGVEGCVTMTNGISAVREIGLKSRSGT